MIPDNYRITEFNARSYSPAQYSRMMHEQIIAFRGERVGRTYPHAKQLRHGTREKIYWIFPRNIGLADSVMHGSDFPYFYVTKKRNVPIDWL